MWHIWETGGVHARFYCGDLEDIYVYGRIVLMVDQDLGWDGLDWIEQAQYRDTWRTLVHALMNFRIPKPRGNFWLSEGLLLCLEEIRSMEVVSSSSQRTKRAVCLFASVDVGIVTFLHTISTVEWTLTLQVLCSQRNLTRTFQYVNYKVENN
jgi:hypothetical protein